MGVHAVPAGPTWRGPSPITAVFQVPGWTCWGGSGLGPGLLCVRGGGREQFRVKGGLRGTFTDVMVSRMDRTGVVKGLQRAGPEIVQPPGKI